MERELVGTLTDDQQAAVRPYIAARDLALQQARNAEQVILSLLRMAGFARDGAAHGIGPDGEVWVASAPSMQPTPLEES